jgi:hypothetical protein
MELNICRKREVYLITYNKYVREDKCFEYLFCKLIFNSTIYIYIYIYICIDHVSNGMLLQTTIGIPNIYLGIA